MITPQPSKQPTLIASPLSLCAILLLSVRGIAQHDVAALTRCGTSVRLEALISAFHTATSIAHDRSFFMQNASSTSQHALSCWHTLRGFFGLWPALKSTDWLR